jgi:hypothetical protein
MKTDIPSKSELANLLERYKTAVRLHRDAVYSITYKLHGSASFGHIDTKMVAEYERSRIELLEAERELDSDRIHRIKR